MADQLRDGQNVTISGLITEKNSNTQIDSITTVVTNSSNNTLPKPVTIATSVLGTRFNGDVTAEQWEGVVVQYVKVVVTKENADGNPGPNITGNYNYGEMLVADSNFTNLVGVPTRVELQEGHHLYHNLWDSTLLSIPGNMRIQTGNLFDTLKGIPYFAFSNYKIVPRQNSDFIRHTTGINDAKTIVNRYELSQNYPNPFNPITTFNYNLTSSGIVTIKVYNILGKEVKTLINQFQNAGSYKLAFDGRDLASGVYFYQIKVNNFIDSKKMILLK